MTNIVGESQWISRGVPLFLILHIGFVYFFGCWHNTESKQRSGEDNRALKQKGSRIAGNGSNWIILLIFLVTLRAVAVLFVHNLLKHLHGLRSSPVANNTFIDFTILPLVVVAVDHSTNIGLALRGDVSGPWTSLAQSTLSTYFFVRPLAALAGHDVDPAGGRMSFGSCLLATAIWLSIPGVPRRFCFTSSSKTRSANVHQDFIKGLVLLFAYSYVAFTCATHPGFLERHIL